MVTPPTTNRSNEMNKTTGKLKFAYDTIRNLEGKIESLEMENKFMKEQLMLALPILKKVVKIHG